MDDQTPQEATLTAEEHASLTARFGDSVKVWEIGNRRWVLRKPSRAQWQAYKCDSQSVDPTTKADAAVQLARSLLAPLDPKGTLDAERAAFDQLGEDYPALLDVLGAAAEGVAAGPMPLREVKPPRSTQPDGKTPTQPPTP